MLVRELSHPGFKNAFNVLLSQPVSFQAADSLHQLASVLMPEVNKYDEDAQALELAGAESEGFEEKKVELLARQSTLQTQPKAFLREFKVSAADLSFLAVLFK
jgi:hypothetical protein